jgi:hypothetical protein
MLLGFFFAFAHAQENDNKQSAPVGKFFDPENLEQINKVEEGYSAAKTSKDAYGTLKNQDYKSFATSTFSKYQNSKAGLFYQVGKFQKKMHSIISKVSARVDRWRTTVPRLRAYKERIVHFADDSYTFSRTFEVSDLWDLDRDFSREMEERIKQGRTLGTSIWDYLARRVESQSFAQTLQDIFFPDYEASLNKSSIGGFYYNITHSKSEKVPIFVMNEAFGVMGVVKSISEEEFAGFQDGIGQAKQNREMQQLKEALTDNASSYTDQLQVRQDLLNKLYEVNTKRSMLKDRSAYLDLLWGRLAQQDVEARIGPTAAIAREISALTRLELDPDNYVLRRYGLENPNP